MKLKELKRFLYERFFSPHLSTQELSKEISSYLVNSAHLPVEDVFLHLKSSENGLSEEEVAIRLKKYGPNEIAHTKPPSWYFLLFRNFKNPFIALILILGIVSFFLKEYNSVMIIAFMVLVSVLMRFIQEYRSNNAAEKLKALVSTKATVIRNIRGESKSFDVDMKHLVPGDVIHLCVGDMIPADIRLVKAKGIYVSQSSLTGEAMPIEKDESFIPKEGVTNPLDMPNLCFMGTNVANGTATAIVLATGNQSYFGTLAKSILDARPLTSFDLGINKVSWLLIRFVFLMVPFVFIINGLTKGDWFQSLLFSLSVAIGLTPEMLPMIVTTNLARGAVKMAQSKVVVKQLNAIQNFGAMDVLCTDKTGTLTQDKIILERHLDAKGEENAEVLLYGYLNSFYQTGLKNLLDLAVLEHQEIKDRLSSESPYIKVDEIPFDFSRRRMSVVVRKDERGDLLICKGAVEEVLALCKDVRVNGNKCSLDGTIQAKLDAVRHDLSEDGLRILAVAYKELPHLENKEYTVEDEQNLIFLGLLAFLDPPKQSAGKALANLKKASVEVKVLTGDNEIVTQKICKWVNLDVIGVITGNEIDVLNDQELCLAVEKNTVFAKLTPIQKARIIASLKTNGHTVGFLGDGINDAPALCAADIGISVDTAVDIAKESADIIMLEKSLLFLAEGVIEGRRTFANIMKYIKMALSSNFGNVLSIVGASIIFPFLPMLSVQLLLQNLLYDLSQLAIPFDHVDKEFLLKPRKWNPSGIAKFMVCIGPISSIFDYATFAVMWFVFGATTLSMQAVFQSGWFIEGLLSQVLIVHMIRTQKIPFLQSMGSKPLIFTTLAIMAIGVYIPYSFIGNSIGLAPLPPHYFYFLGLIVCSYCVLTQFVKMWFIRRFNYWL